MSTLSHSLCQFWSAEKRVGEHNLQQPETDRVVAITFLTVSDQQTGPEDTRPYLPPQFKKRVKGV